MFDLVIKGGEVIDPAQGLHAHRDIGISSGKISHITQDIPAGAANRVIDASGKLVTPGLIDLHLHVAEGIIHIGMHPDRAGVRSGVTTVCDGGSTGCANFPEFRNRIISQAQTNVFCFLHICPTGLAALDEIRTWQDISTDDTLKTAMENRDVVKGIKIRVTNSLAENLGIEAIRVAKKVAVQAGMPLMVHVGNLKPRLPEDVMDAFTRELLPILEKGDILLHIFTWSAGGVIKPDGSVLPEFRKAIEKGVIVDSAHGLYHFSFPIAKLGLAQDILPTTISTDLSTMSAECAVLSLPVTMSKFLALGLSLEQVIEMTTINPARVLGEEHRRGTLKVGMPADISVLELTEGDFSFSDGKGGNTLAGKLLLTPYLTLKCGVEIKPESITREVEKCKRSNTADSGIIAS